MADVFTTAKGSGGVRSLGVRSIPLLISGMPLARSDEAWRGDGAIFHPRSK